MIELFNFKILKRSNQIQSHIRLIKKLTERILTIQMRSPV